MLPVDTFAPDDSTLRGVITHLQTLARQIQGVGVLYNNPPDGAPEDNSVIFIPVDWQVNTDTIGRVTTTWTIQINHCFRRTRLDTVYPLVMPYVMPWLRALTAWPNQQLDGVSLYLDPESKPGQLHGFNYGNTPLLAITNTVKVVTEEPVITA